MASFLGQTVVYTNRPRTNAVLVPLRPMSRPGRLKKLLSGGCMALALLLLNLPCSSGSEQMDTRSWGLKELVNHLNSRGIRLHVISTYASGDWGNSLYLTEDPKATWSDFQGKHRRPESVCKWQGAVWIEHSDPHGGTEWDVEQWQEHGCQIGRFVLFGDAQLIERIHKSLTPAPPKCKLKRWLCPATS